MAFWLTFFTVCMLYNVHVQMQFLPLYSKSTLKTSAIEYKDERGSIGTLPPFFWLENTFKAAVEQDFQRFSQISFLFIDFLSSSKFSLKGVSGTSDNLLVGDVICHRRYTG
jgi:hypothetical protein